MLLMHYYNITLMLNRGAETRRLTTDGHGPAVVEVLEHIAVRHAKVYAYMVMPDHIHLLFGRDKPLDDVDKFAGRVKRRINNAFERRDRHKLKWIDGCVSYPVTSEGLAAARDYILQNPVRGLLVKRAEDWPYKGTPAPL
jgi:REP element-mobilizing transposase RayT